MTDVSKGDLRARRRPVARMAGMLADRLGISETEVIELLERLPFGEYSGDATPEAWQRPAARRVLERYAARKRAITRLAARGLL